MTLITEKIQADINRAVVELQQSPYMVYLWTTGAALGTQKMFWDVSGTSKVLIRGMSTYDMDDTAIELGRTPNGYTSTSTAIGMANHAYLKGLEVLTRKGSDSKLLGGSATCAVQTDRERRGDDKAFLAVSLGNGDIIHAEVYLTKNIHTRGEQGEICDILMLNMLCEAADIDQVTIPHSWQLIEERSNLGHQAGEAGEDDGYCIVPRQTNHGAGVRAERMSNALDRVAIQEVLDGDGMVYISADGEILPVSEGFDPDQSVLFSGSFIPLHHGHGHVAAAGTLETSKTVTFELSTLNAEKDSKEIDPIIHRAYQMLGKWPVIISTGNPRFIDKSDAYPEGTSFLLGADTIDRAFSVDPRWTKTFPELHEQLAGMHYNGTKFYVLGRRTNGDVLKLSNVLSRLSEQDTVCHTLAAALCTPLAGLVDVSSSQLRAKS